MKRTSRRFADRTEAGRLLARRVAALGLTDPVVLALPRGGVPVAIEIARTLNAPLDLVLVRKIGVPQQRELAAAAVVDGATPEIVVNDAVVRRARLSRDWIEAEARREQVEIERRRKLYLSSRPRIPLDGRELVLVDDGIATGASVRAALTALRRRSPRRLVLAVPVAARDAVASIRNDVDDVVCLEQPSHFQAIGQHYDDFHQVPDAEVIALMDDLDASSGRSPDHG